MSTKLDYTIELDGQEFDITAAEVKSALAIKESVIDSATKEPKTIAKNYNGANTVQLNVVPSSGGAFTGPIQVPSVDNPEDLDNKDYVANIGNINTLIETIKGFPTYRWEESELKPLIIRAGDSAKFSPLKVVLYSDPNNNNPTDITFKDEASNDMECWFLAFNDQTGWMSLGHYAYDTSKEKYLTTYIDLFVSAALLAANANHAANADHANTAIYANNLQNAENTSEIYTYENINDLFNLVNATDKSFWDKVKDFFEGNTSSIPTELQILRKDLTTHTTSFHITQTQYNKLNNHTKDSSIHRGIAYGTATIVNDAAFKAGSGTTATPAIGSIYIKLN